MRTDIHIKKMYVLLSVLVILRQVYFNNAEYSSISPPFLSNDFADKYNFTDCQTFPTLPNAYIKVETIGHKKLAIINCKDGYNIMGSTTVICSNGKWIYETLPKCERGCSAPKDLIHGAIEFDGQTQKLDTYKEGTWANYICSLGYKLDPFTSKYRACKNGQWTGEEAVCRAASVVCPTLKQMENGYYVSGNTFVPKFEEFRQTVRVFCNPGHMLVGPKILECINDGEWSSKVFPKCQSSYDIFKEAACDTLPTVAHSSTQLVEQYDATSLAGSVVEVRCAGKYRNSIAPCQSSRLRCKDGRWIGILPTCVLADACLPPPLVPYAMIVNLNFEANYDSSKPPKFPIRSKITYECIKGYILEGNPVLTCSSSGCWQPSIPPVCIKINNSDYYLEVNNVNAILISAATGAGILGILLLICLVVACRRRKIHSRVITTTPPVPQRQDLNDYAVVLQHPDRLALIAFADGVQTRENALPSYEEAVRNDRGGAGSANLTVSRLQRPHFPNLGGGRRARNSPNPDLVHVPRHGSFTHSTRSGGDSMGSTDTVTVSEGSTNVTLDTVSSLSGSQNASCRAHWGSLASFDACSMVNNEDVPLIEESELEEIQGGNNEMENPVISDNSSSKVSTNSAPGMTA